MVLADLVRRYFAQISQHADSESEQDEGSGATTEGAVPATATQRDTSTGSSSNELEFGANSALTEMVQGIDAGHTTLLQLVENLGEKLTSSDPFERAKGVQLLESVVERVRPDILAGQPAAFLLQFFLDRLHDQLSVGNLLRGIVVILRHGVVSASEVARIPMGIFKELNIQSFQQPVRQSVFQIFDILLDRHLDAMKTLGDDFVFGYAQSMDGEKDPRNLMTAFSIIVTLAKNFDISRHIDDMFDVVFCYFPITFRAPPDDPFGITADDLKNSLRKCLASTPLFGPLAFPLLLEKLSSTSTPAKRDSLDALAHTIPVYGPDTLEQNLTQLWELLREEIYHAKEADVSRLGHDVLKATLRCLATSTNPKIHSSFLNTIHADLTRHLKDLDTKNAQTTSKLLRTLCASTDSVCCFIVDKFAGVILPAIDKEDYQTRKHTLVECMRNMVAGSNDLYGVVGMKRNDSEDLQNPLAPYKDQIFEVFRANLFSGADNDGYRLVGLFGLYELSLSRGLTTDADVASVVRNLGQIVLARPDEEVEEVFDEVLRCLRGIANTRPELIKEHCLMEVFNEIAATNSRLFKTIAFLSDVNELLPYNVEQLSKRIPTPPTPELLDTLSRIFASNVHLPSFPSVAHRVIFKQLVPKVLSLEWKDPHAQRTVSSMAALVVRCEAKKKVEVIADNPFINVTRQCERALYSLDLAEQRLVILLAAVLGNIPNPVFAEGLPVACLSCVLNTSFDNLAAHYLTLLLAALVNATDDPTPFLYSVIIPTLRLVIEDDNETLDRKLRALECFARVMKGLVIRSHKAGYEMAQLPLSLLDSPTLGKAAARGLGAVLDENDDAFVLTRQSFAVFRPLYKQRFFAYIKPHLLTAHKVLDTSAADNKSVDVTRSAGNHLTTLSSLLAHLPKQVILNELQPLLPLLFSSVQPEAETETKLATLNTFITIGLSNISLLEPHVAVLVPKLLALTNPRLNAMQVRINALRLLVLLASSVKYETLHPLKSRVIRELEPALDDPKRAVRAEAVQCRNVFFLLSSNRK